MKKAIRPKNEDLRLDALDKLNILDSLREQIYDDLTLLAATICDAPIALLSFISDEEQWFKSYYGIEVTESPRDLAFCSHAILEKERLYIPDAREDDRFEDNPFVTEAPFIRSYLGVPLKVGDGLNVGTLAIIDHKPRTLSSKQLEGVHALARQVESHLKMRYELEVAKKDAEVNSKNLFEVTDELENRILMERTQEAAKIGSWQVDIATNKVKWSKMTYKIHEVDVHEELRVEDGINFYIEEHRPLIQACIENAIKNKTGWDIQLQIQTKLNNIRWVRAIGFPVFEGSDLVRLEGIFQDINDSVLNQEQLAQEKEKAEKALASRTIFLANMSHEFRTPLNGIIGFASLLLEQNSSKKSQAYLSHIQNCGEDLLTLVNDILDLSKIESGKLSLERIPFNFSELVETTVLNFQPIIDEKGLKTFIEIDSELTDEIYGDPLRIKQILLNLVGNAVKFTESGSISVKAKLKKDKVVVDVVDTGIGIPEEVQGRLFKSFEQVDSSTSRRFGGSGLGLAICENLVTLMEGSIFYSSKEKSGSKFTFSFASEVVSSSVSADSLEGNKLGNISLDFFDRPILVVEDNKLNTILMKKILEKIGFKKIDFAVNGVEAVELAERNTYEVIFMDVQMPVMDGNDATKVIRKDLNSDCFIIGVSANNFHEDKLKAMSSGMNAYIEKPIKFKDIKKVLCELNKAEGSKAC